MKPQQSRYQWPALEVGSARLLAIPIQTKFATASPFRGQFVSPGSKKAFLARLPNHVDKWSVTQAGKMRS